MIKILTTDSIERLIKDTNYQSNAWTPPLLM